MIARPDPAMAQSARHRTPQTLREQELTTLLCEVMRHCKALPPDLVQRVSEVLSK